MEAHMTAPFYLPKLKLVEARAAPEPIRNALVSMSLLHRVEVQGDQGLARFFSGQLEQDNWVSATARSLSTADLHTNRLIFEGLSSIFLFDDQHSDFGVYVENLAAQPAEELRDRVLRPLRHGDNPASLVINQDAYIERLTETYDETALDMELLREVHGLLNDPMRLQKLVVGHLRLVWEHALAAEWRKKSKLVQILANGIQQRSLPIADAPTTIRAVIGRDLPIELALLLPNIRQIIFVPSPHVGLYATRFDSTDTLWIFVAVSTITSWTLRQGPIKTSEVLARVAPLADETGLRLLDFIAREGEVTTQDLIAMLGISQSGVSRHLKALGGYIQERRGEGASKRYRLSRSHLDWTIVTLRRFLETEHGLTEEADLSINGRGFAPASGQPVGPQRSTVEVDSPADLKRFMDAQGLLNMYPTRRRDQLAVLAFLIEKFELGRDYSEREVNEVLKSTLNPTNNDFATLRRELYDAGLLNRERNGSRYWRAQPEYGLTPPNQSTTIR
jgi:DNA-binding transcriptional ArsR family regulator